MKLLHTVMVVFLYAFLQLCSGEKEDKSIKKKADIHLVVSAGDSRQTKVVTIPIDSLRHSSSRSPKTYVYPPTRVDLYSPPSKNGQDGSSKTDDSHLKSTYHETIPRPSSSTEIFHKQIAYEKAMPNEKTNSVYRERPFYYSGNDVPGEKRGSMVNRGSWKPMRSSNKPREIKSEKIHVQHEDKEMPEAPRQEVVEQPVEYKYYEKPDTEGHRVQEDVQDDDNYRVIRIPRPSRQESYQQISNYEPHRRPETEMKPVYEERHHERHRVRPNYDSNYRVIRVPVPVDYEGPRSMAIPNYENSFKPHEPAQKPHYHYEYHQIQRHPERHRYQEPPRQMRHYVERVPVQEMYFQKPDTNVKYRHHHHRERFNQQPRFEHPRHQYVEETRPLPVQFYPPRPRQVGFNSEMDIYHFERRPEDQELDASDSIARPVFALPPNALPKPLPPGLSRPLGIPRIKQPLPGVPNQMRIPFQPRLLPGTGQVPGKNGFKVVYLPYNVLQNVLQGNSQIDIMRLK